MSFELRKRGSSKSGARSYPFLVAVIAIALMGAGCSKPAPPPPQIDVATVKMTPRAATVTESYVAQMEARNAIEIRPRVGGLLQKQYVADGQAVKQGQQLFVIDPQPYVVELAQARAGLAQTEATREQSERDFGRIEPLLAIDAISRQDYDAAWAKSIADRAAVEAAQARVKTAELNLGYTTVTSPINGVMGRALIKEGGLVNANTSLLTTVYSIDPIYVDFSISEQRLLAFQRQLGRTADQNSRTPPPYHLILGDGGEYPQQPKLNFVDPAVDKTTGTLAVRLEVPNPNNLLRAGQFGRVVMDVQQLTDAMLVPQRAVQDLQGQSFLWIVDAENKAQTREVTMGARIGSEWLVTKGLKPGDVVIVDGVQKLKPGVAVHARPLATEAPAPAQTAPNSAAKPQGGAPEQAPATPQGKAS